jgi:hypothetical protein
MTCTERQFNPCCRQNGNQEHGAYGSSCECAPETPWCNRNSEFDEEPSADHSADEAEDHVNDATEAAAARNMTGDPTGQQADDNCGYETGRGNLNEDCVFVDLRRECSGCGECEVGHEFPLRYLNTDYSACRSHAKVIPATGVPATGIPVKDQLERAAAKRAYAWQKIYPRDL